MKVYYIFAVEKDIHGDIVSVTAFGYENEKISGSVTWGRDQAMDQVDKETVFTAVWNYSTQKWDPGAQVKTVEGRKRPYLRSSPDASKKDNLDSLILWNHIKPIMQFRPKFK